MEINLPKFIFGENYDLEEDIFIIHTQFPRFIYSDKVEEVEWIDKKDEDGFPISEYNYDYLIQEAIDFLETELDKWCDDDDEEDNDWKKGYQPTELN